MKQSTLLGVFRKNSTLNEKSDHFELTGSVNEIARLDPGTVTKDISKLVDSPSTQPQSTFVSDVSPVCDVTNIKTKGLNLSASGVKLEGEVERYGEKINIKNGDEKSKKVKSSLSLSTGKGKSQVGKEYSSAEMKAENKSKPELEDNGHMSLAKKTSMNHLNLLEKSQSSDGTTKVSVGNSDGELSSSVGGKKVVDSMEYKEFIAQLAQKNEQKTKHDIQASQSNEADENDEAKKRMSYSEFLGMFKSPPKVEDSALADGDVEAEVLFVPETEKRKEVKCKSIASYFSKTESKSRKITSVTVSAEIHSSSLSVENSKKLRSPCSMKLPGKIEEPCHISNGDKNEIEFLSSETISDTENGLGKKVLATKRRNIETSVTPLHISKKQKVEPQPVMPNKQNMEIVSDISKKQKVKTPSQECETVNIDIVAICGEESFNMACSESADTEEVEPSSSVAQTTSTIMIKTSQSTLCFGKSGLSLKRGIEPKGNTSVDEELYSEIKISDKEPAGRLSTRRATTGNEDVKNRAIHEDSGIGENKCTAQSGRTITSQHKRHHLDLCDSLVPATTAQKSSENDTKVVETETGEENVQKITSETPMLRRSSRLAQSVQTVKDIDVVEIASDDEEEVELIETKKRGKKGGTRKTSIGDGSQSESCSKKPTGKLASIFTTVKSKEQTGKIIPLQVDPQQDRLKREFLMSGIPEELKRQIASTAIATVSLDYPPFPSVSHVQQIVKEMCLPVKVKIPTLFHTFSDEDYESIHHTSLKWDSLGWKHLEKINSLHRDLFENVTTSLPLQDPQLDALLKELQCSDSRFPFRRTYVHLHSKVTSSELSSCEAPGNKIAAMAHSDVTVIEDNDVVIVNDASPVSERPVLKHTSEPKASLWSDLHQPESSEQIIGNAKAMKQLKRWLEEWKVLVEKQVRKASKISKSTSRSKGKGGWSDDSDFTDSDEEEMALCNSVLITGPHGVGKTASVYALAKELGYKVFEVNSSSLRSGKQLLAQLEEATQSHRVAQNKSKSPIFLDTPPAGTSSTKLKESDKGVKPKPASSVNLAFANLFRLTTPQAVDTSQSGAQTKRNKLKLSVAECKSGDLKKNIKPADMEMTESFLAKTDRRKKNKELTEETLPTKIKKHRGKEDTCPAEIRKQKGISGQQMKTDLLEVKSQTNSDSNITSGSLNLTSASLILFDEVDVVFDEDKGFLATVQHFMMSTKIPIVLTSTDFSFHLQLQARHDHISLHRPSLISAASFLSTLCLAHGVRVDHQSILNAIRFMRGDIRRCLLYLQYWCESGGGIVQVAREVDPNSWLSCIKNTDSEDVDEKFIIEKQPLKTLGSRIMNSDDSSDSDFICLRPPKKKARQMTTDEDDSSRDAASITLENSNKSSITKSIVLEDAVCVDKKGSQQKKAKFSGKQNASLENAGNEHRRELPLMHIKFEESLLGLHDCDMSTKSILDFITTPALSCLELERAVQSCSIISQALSIDVIYHVVLHGIPLPKSDIVITQPTLPAKHKVLAPETSKKSRKRIIQGDWLNSDSSDEDLHQGKNLAQDSTKDHDNFNDGDLHDNGSNLKDEDKVSLKSSLENRLSDRCKIKDRVNYTKSESKNASSKLMVSVLSECARFYDNLSFIDCLEPRSSSFSHSPRNGIKLIPGLSDEEIHSKLSHNALENWHCNSGGHVNVLAARRFCSSIGEHVKSSKTLHGLTNLDNTKSSSSCGENDATAVICDLDWPEEFHLPVQKVLPDLWSIADKVQSQSLSSEPAFKNVSKCLGPTVQSSDPSLHLDYIPYLREICRLENERRLAKTQRRFHHYLDNIGLSLKESTIASLTSTYAVDSGSRET